MQSSSLKAPFPAFGRQAVGKLRSGARELRDRSHDIVTSAVRDVLRSQGFELRRIPLPHEQSEDSTNVATTDFDDEAVRIILGTEGLTMTSPERLFALIESVRYVERAAIPGDIVECGVWMGGSMKAAADTLISIGSTKRTLWLYDTYDGLPEATEHDIDFKGLSQMEIWRPGMEKAPLYRVKDAMNSTGYPRDRIEYIVGKVEETFPERIPDSIALLRLDTDYYSSTKHELENLIPLVSRGGVVIIDDYGHFLDARRAVDEYLEQQRMDVLLSRIDYSARLFVKLAE
jgi:hypothetical protein